MGIENLPGIPNTFPYSLSEDSLRAIIEMHLHHLDTNSNQYENYVAKTRIDMAQKELERRVVAKNNMVTKKLSRVTIGLAIITIAFAILNVSFQFLDQRFDEKWLENQEKYNKELINKFDNFYQLYTIEADTNKKIEPAN